MKLPLTGYGTAHPEPGEGHIRGIFLKNLFLKLTPVPFSVVEYTALASWAFLVSSLVSSSLLSTLFSGCQVVTDSQVSQIVQFIVSLITWILGCILKHRMLQMSWIMAQNLTTLSVARIRRLYYTVWILASVPSCF